MGWDMLSNGDLACIAEEQRFALLLTMDQNLRYQQNSNISKISILVLSTTRWPCIQSVTAQIAITGTISWRENSVRC
jgi:hypothetical protein